MPVSDRFTKEKHQTAAALRISNREAQTDSTPETNTILLDLKKAFDVTKYWIAEGPYT